MKEKINKYEYELKKYGLKETEFSRSEKSRNLINLIKHDLPILENPSQLREEDIVWYGKIVSRPFDLLIEITPNEVNEFFKNQTRFVGHYSQHGKYSYKKMKYYTEDNEAKKVIWNILQYLNPDLFNLTLFTDINFKKGYFEFIRTNTGNTKFTYFSRKLFGF